MNESALEVLKAMSKTNRLHHEYSSEKMVGAPQTTHVVVPPKRVSAELQKDPVVEDVPVAQEEPKKMKGLGDLVAKTIEKTTGIKSKEGCGCKKRQAALNKWVPFHKNKAKK